MNRHLGGKTDYRAEKQIDGSMSLFSALISEPDKSYWGDCVCAISQLVVRLVLTSEKKM
jgi:phage gp46-like protein